MKVWHNLGLWLGLLLTMATFTTLFAQSPTQPTQTEAIQSLQQETPGVQIYLRGNHVTRVWGVPFANGNSPTDTALNFLARYAALFNPGDSEFHLQNIQDVMNGKFTAVYFTQTLNGVPVDSGLLTLLVRNTPDYPLVLASSGVKPITNQIGKPTIPAADAIQIAQQSKPALKSFTPPELVAYLEEVNTHLAWTFIADNENPVQPERYQVFVDANTGAVLEWRDQIYYTDVNGHVDGWFSPGLRPDQPNNPEVRGSLAGLLVNIIGGNSVFSGLDGNFVIPHGGTSQVTVQAQLQGRWVRVQNQAGSNLVLQQNVVPPGPANFEFNTNLAEFNTSQVNGFIHTEVVHNFVKSINPAYPGVDIQMPCNVNIANSCNAFYNGSSINFYRAGGGCPNMAYSTIIYHEYGHHIVESGHPAATGDYHEGMADATAALLVNDPCVGRDFFGQNTGCLRTTDNTTQYPCSGEVHFCGQVIAGAFWHTLDAMKQRYPGNQQFALDKVREWYLNSILLRPNGISPEITIDVLTLDDDDNDIGNGTPHYNQINEGFTRHNMPAPPLDFLFITPVRLPTRLVAPDTRVVFKVRVANGEGQVDPNNVFLYYSVNRGAFQSRQMNYVPARDLFKVRLPGFPCGSRVRYYIEAIDTQGHVVRHPSNAPNETLDFVVGTSLTTIFEDTFTNNLGWTVQNTSLSTGAWTRGDPNGTFQNGPANPEDDSDDPGTFCFFTGQGSVGGSVGENDVDGGPTALLSPTLNLAGINAIIEYRRWFYNGTVLDDSMVVEVSNDNGTTWTTVETVTFSGNENQWVQRSFMVSDYVTPTNQVRVRFRTSDNPNNSIVEAGVDHFIVKRIDCN